MKRIKDEMLKKNSELHELMTGGGLAECAAMLEKCLAAVMRPQSNASQVV